MTKKRRPGPYCGSRAALFLSSFPPCLILPLTPICCVHWAGSCVGFPLFFGALPVALIVCFLHVNSRGAGDLTGIVPPLAATALLVYGLWQLGGFQKQERVWRNALDRARVLSLINFGLSPFLYWWNRIPSQRFFLAAVVVDGAVRFCCFWEVSTSC